MPIPKMALKWAILGLREQYTPKPPSPGINCSQAPQSQHLLGLGGLGINSFQDLGASKSMYHGTGRRRGACGSAGGHVSRGSKASEEGFRGRGRNRGRGGWHKASVSDGGGVGGVSACAKGGDPRPVCPYLTGSTGHPPLVVRSHNRPDC